MSDRPNILFLLNDHQCYYGHGEVAGGPKIQRPYFEELAKEGIEFTRAYTACPLCGPARRTMLTGLFPHNHGELLNDFNHPFDTQTYLEILAKNGYQNYYFGKWHAGAGVAQDHYCEGFSCPAYGNPYISDEYKEYLQRYNLPHFQVRIHRSFMNPDWKSTKELGIKVGELYTPKGPNFYDHSIGTMTTPKESHEAYFLATLACGKLEEIARSKTSQPFHMRLDFWGPHHPYYATKEYVNMYPPETIPEYPNFRDNLTNKPKIYKYDFNYPFSRNGRIIIPNPLPWSAWQKTLAFKIAQTTLIDDAGGMVLNKLKELGLDNNTAIIWTTDHGDAVACHGGHFDKDAYMPEEMVRIPLTVKLPDIVSSNQKSDALVSNLDVAPTFLDLAGTKFNNKVDGHSIQPICNGDISNNREDIMVETHGHFHLNLGRLVVHKQYKYIYNEGYMDELYDLKEDPYELNNLIRSEEYQKILANLKTRLRIWREKTYDTMTKSEINKRKVM